MVADVIETRNVIPSLEFKTIQNLFNTIFHVLPVTALLCTGLLS